MAASLRATVTRAYQRRLDTFMPMLCHKRARYRGNCRPTGAAHLECELSIGTWAARTALWPAALKAAPEGRMLAAPRRQGLLLGSCEADLYGW